MLNLTKEDVRGFILCYIILAVLMLIYNCIIGFFLMVFCVGHWLILYAEFYPKDICAVIQTIGEVIAYGAIIAITLLIPAYNYYSNKVPVW